MIYSTVAIENSELLNKFEILEIEFEKISKEFQALKSRNHDECNCDLSLIQEIIVDNAQDITNLRVTLALFNADLTTLILFN
jgi:hypothetical protein